MEDGTEPEAKKAGRKRMVPVEPPAGKLLLVIPEVMFLTGYSERQIRVFLAEGRLKDVSADRTVRVRRGDVLRLIDGKEPR